MRMLTVVVVGAVLFGTAYDASAEERADPTNFYVCSEKCDRGYDACMRRRTGKGTEDCPGTLVKCRGTCDPEWRTISKQAAAPRSCRDKCQATFDACVHADDGKHGGTCAKDVMVCRNACPPEEAPPVASSAPDAAEAAPAVASPAAASVDTAAAPRGAAPAVVVPPPAPEKVAAPEKIAAPERASAPAPPIDKREAAPHAVAPAGAVANAPRAGTTPAAAALPENTLRPAPAPPAGPQGATRAKQPRRSLWARMWCSVAYCGSGATAQKPMSCSDACIQDYDTCVAHEDPKRGSGCAAASLRCRQGCKARRAP